MKDHSNRRGFTIVELLIVIVVIAILAAITIVAYNGISRRAVESSMQSELGSAASKLGIAKTTADTYPASLNAAGISFSSGVAEYTSSSSAFCITVSSVRYQIVFSIDQEGVIKRVACTGHSGLNQVATTNAACFAFNSGTKTITSYYNKESNISSNPVCPRDVVIPSTIGGVDVKIIGLEAFRNKSLTSAVLPNTVTDIKGNAFQDNVLTSVTIPSSVTTITGGSFNNNQLPDSQAFTFKRNTNGTDDTTTLIGYGGAKRSGVVVPSTVTRIEPYAFSAVSMTSVTLPNSVVSIGANALSGLGLTSLTLGNAITTIEQYAFAFNQLTTVTVPATVTYMEQGVLNGNQLIDAQAFLYKRNSNGTIDTSTIIGYGGAKRSGIVIPNGVTTIGDEAFFSSGISSITFPSSIATINTYSFVNNYSLTSVSVPSAAYVHPDAFDSGVTVNRF